MESKPDKAYFDALRAELLTIRQDLTRLQDGFNEHHARWGNDASYSLELLYRVDLLEDRAEGIAGVLHFWGEPQKVPADSEGE